MRWFLHVVPLCTCVLILDYASSFSPHVHHNNRLRRHHRCLFETRKATSGYDDSDAASKGFVSTLTDAVNFVVGSRGIMRTDETNNRTSELVNANPPTRAEELMERIRDDYVCRNYLWTGDIDLACFDRDCQFTDPTLSFTGRDTFVNNIANLRPIVDKLVQRPGETRSELLDIQLDPENGFVQTRWNMVGELNNLPWKPKIDVIGRTKFWYRNNNMIEEEEEDGSDDQQPETKLQVYFYDEEWEISAGRALLQLVTPAGTIKNQL